MGVRDFLTTRAHQGRDAALLIGSTLFGLGCALLVDWLIARTDQSLGALDRLLVVYVPVTFLLTTIIEIAFQASLAGLKGDQPQAAGHLRGFALSGLVVGATTVVVAATLGVPTAEAGLFGAYVGFGVVSVGTQHVRGRWLVRGLSVRATTSRYLPQACAVLFGVVDRSILAILTGLLVGQVAYLGVSFSEAWATRHQRRPGASRRSLQLGAASLLVACTVLIDLSFAKFLDEGSASVYAIGVRASTAVLGGVITPLAMVITARLARMADSPDARWVHRLITVALMLGALALIPTMVAAPWALRLAYRGSTVGTRVGDLVTVTRVLLISLPTQLAGTLATRVLIRADAAGAILRAATITIVLDLVTDAVFIHFFHLPGLAISTVVVSTTSAIVLGRAASLNARDQVRQQPEGIAGV